MSAHVSHEVQPLRRTQAYESAWVGAVLLCLLSVAVRAINLDRLPVTDELYTLLAAQGWLETGAPQIGEGIYERAQAYTLLLAGWLAVFGDSWVSARTLSLVFGSALVVSVFLWTSRVAGRLAAWITGLFVALEPLSVDVSQFVRFYALHALVFWLSTTGAYALATQWRPPGRRMLLALGTIVGFLFALHLQILTLCGLAGLGLWLVLAVGIPWLRAQDARRRQVALAAAGGLIVLAGAALLLSGLAEALLERYRWAPLWNRAHRNEFWYYHLYFVERWPTLWSLTPLALLLAIVHRPRPAVLCMCVFVVSFVLLSFGGMKEPRYMFFLLPFLFVLWGIALAKAFDLLYPWLIGATDRVLRRLAPYLAGQAVRAGLIGAGIVFLVASNGGAVKALLSLGGTRLVAAEGGGIGVSTDAGRADWAAARDALTPFLETASIVLTSRDVHFLHYLGDYDVALNSSRLTEIRGNDFARDPRTGKAVIGTAEALGTTMECFSSGLIVTDAASWRLRAGITDEVADRIEAETAEIALPLEAGLLAFRWEHPVPDPTPAACAEIQGPRLAPATGGPPLTHG
ncbi:MAG TPA: hypothetical protein VFZ04_15625 [Longimicrobiales bacterium]